jgi:hypothetical protein
MGTGFQTFGEFGFNSLGQKLARTIAQNLGQRIGEWRNRPNERTWRISSHAVLCLLSTFPISFLCEVPNSTMMKDFGCRPMRCASSGWSCPGVRKSLKEEPAGNGR